MTDSAISLSGVTKTFGATVAVQDLDLEVPRGAMYGFIGPNGAGKTTTIRIVMSIIFPDCGEVRVLGRRSALEAKDRIGYLPEERGVYRKMRVAAFLRYVGQLKGMKGADAGREVTRWLQRVGLGEVAGKRCEELSKGMQQKVQFVATILHRPELLILDEPFSGLDPVNMRLVRDLIREEHERGTTVIFSTHVMHQAEELCDHIVMIHDGSKRLDDGLRTIRERHEARLLEVEPIDPGADLALVAGLDGVAGVERDHDRFHWKVGLAEGAAAQEVLARIVAALPVARVELHRPSLEDVFVEIVTRSGGGSASQLRDVLRGAEVRAAG